MKKFSILIVALAIVMLGTQSCIAQSKIFKEAASIDKVTSVYISPTLLKLGASYDNLGHGLDDAIKELNALEVITCDEDVQKIPLVKGKCRPIIDKLGCEVLMEVNDEGDKVTIFAKIIPNTDIAEVIVVEVDEPDDEYTVIYIKGKIDVKELAKEYSH